MVCCIKIISSIYKKYNYLLDPHTAVAMKEALEASSSNNHYIVLATAHPAKFPKLYEKLKLSINFPKSLQDLISKNEFLHYLDATYYELSKFITRNN